MLDAAIHTALLLIAERVRDYANSEAPYRSSDLRASLTVQEAGETTVIVGTNLEYAPYVHQGTGLYGPFHQVIRPTSKRALFWPGAAHPVKSVKGQPANPFLERALQQVIPEVPDLLAGVVVPAVAETLQANLRDTTITLPL